MHQGLTESSKGVPNPPDTRTSTNISCADTLHRTKNDASIMRHPKNNTSRDTRVFASRSEKIIFFANMVLEMCVRPVKKPRDDQRMVTLSCGAVRRPMSHAYPQPFCAL